MFTGIIEQTGKVRSFTPGAGAARLVVEAPGVAERLRLGDSVAVSGVCLTALEMGPDWFAAGFDKVATGSRFYKFQVGNIGRTLKNLKAEFES